MWAFLRHTHRRFRVSGITFRLWLSACLISLVLFGQADLLAAETGIEPGDQAQDFTLRDANGVFHTLGAYRGDVLVLYFAMWCTTCRANTLELQREIYLPLKDKRVRVFAVDYLGNKQEEIRSIVLWFIGAGVFRICRLSRSCRSEQGRPA